MDIKYIDIGVNLFSRQFKEPEKILEESINSGVGMILTGSDIEEIRKIDKFSREHNIYGTAGIHPHNADFFTPEMILEIKERICNNPKIIAVGECGLDYNRMFSKKENQEKCLLAHIELAECLKKPMFLHERDAGKDMAKIFEEHLSICEKSVIHCFTGNRESVEKYLEMGFYIGITGWICDDKRADSLRDAVKVIPLDKLLLETDAPYLTPKNVKDLGRVNYPKNITYVAEEVARYMEKPVSVIMESALKNTYTLFGNLKF